MPFEIQTLLYLYKISTTLRYSFPHVFPVQDGVTFMEHIEYEFFNFLWVWRQAAYSFESSGHVRFALERFELGWEELAVEVIVFHEWLALNEFCRPMF